MNMDHLSDINNSTGLAPAVSTSNAGFASLVPPVWRASTVLFPSLDAFVARKERLPDGFTYGTTGTPTQRELETRIAALDAANHCVVFPSGQAAICNTLLATVKSGDHLLMPDSAYGPAKTFALEYLAMLGVEVEIYDPRIGADISASIKKNTRMIWMESPGTITMEMQDVPAIAAAAKARSVLTAIDNTWASPIGFTPLDYGVDFCIHACTKYMGGHSDVLMGSVSTRSPELYRKIRALQATMGQAVSAEDCFLVQRGLETLNLRVERQSASTQTVGQYLAQHRAVQQVMLPSLKGSLDNAVWNRDFRLSGCVMSLQLKDSKSHDPLSAYRAMFGAFKLFSIGASWGGVHSIAAFYPASDIEQRTFRGSIHTGPIVRLSIGLEQPQALIAELDTALAVFEQNH